jgi:uncharacterized protein DUF3306
MSDKQFLARWSRRKQEAKASRAESAQGEAAEEQGLAPSESTAAEPVPPDLSNLPPIESIDAATDIAAFLRKGIPQELSRAALRRAWTADPAIRDFVGLAESAWDFNDPKAMAGFGPLDYSVEQVDALVRRIVRGAVQAADSLATPRAEIAEDPAQSEYVEVGFVHAPDSAKLNADTRTFNRPASAELPSSSAASQPAVAKEETSLPRRTHGKALPQ